MWLYKYISFLSINNTINILKWTAFVPELGNVIKPNRKLNVSRLLYVIFTLYISLLYAVFIYLIIW